MFTFRCVEVLKDNGKYSSFLTLCIKRRSLEGFKMTRENCKRSIK